MTTRIKTALVSDFDGTISDNDFFYYISERYLGKAALEPWREYMEGKKTHFEALREIFAGLRIDKKELDEFICKIKIDCDFFKTTAYCQQQNIPVYICSAGCDYYIEKLIGPQIAEYGIKLVANYGKYSQETGLQMTPPTPDSQFYDFYTGISKAKIVKYLQDEGYKVIYCGDGMPDVAAAQIADVVFARKMLWLQCQNLKIQATKLKDFEQVCLFLQGEKA